MFRNCFYIRQFNDSTFNLRLIDTHFCITAGSYAKCLQMVTEYVKRYKTDVGVYKAMRNLDCQGKVGRVAFEEYEEWYTQSGEADKFIKDIKAAIKEGEAYLKEHTVQKSIKRRLNKIGISPKIVSTESVEDSQPITVQQVSSQPVLVSPIKKSIKILKRA